MRLPDNASVPDLHPQELVDATALSTRMEVLQLWSDRVVLEITERSGLAPFSLEGRSAGQGDGLSRSRSMTSAPATPR